MISARRFCKSGFALRLAPTVLLELEHLICFGVQPHRALARKAADKIAEWQLTPFDLPSVSQAIAERFVHRLLQQRLIPDDEFNDGLILAETSLADIPLLVTSDKHLLDIDETSLLVALKEGNLSPVHPVHPKSLLRALR